MAGLDVRWIRVLCSRPGDDTCCTSTALAGEASKGLDIYGRATRGDAAGMGRRRGRRRCARRLSRSQTHPYALDPVLRSFCHCRLSWNYWSLLTFRFLTGLGLGAEWGPGAAIVAESWPSASRGRAAGALHSAYGVGFLLASGIWLLLRSTGPSSWRYMFVIGILPAFLLLYVRRWVDEPAIWIAANRGRREAQMRLQMGGVSPQDRELAQFTVTRILSDLVLRRRVGLLLLMAITSVVPWWSASTWIPEYAAQLSIKLPSSLTGLVFSAGSIAGFLAMGLLADLLGRKPVIWLFYLGALSLSLCFFLLVTDRRALLIMAAANGFFSSGQFAWMTIYLPELFPTRVRGTAMSLVFDTSRAVSVLCPLLAGWLISLWGSIGAAGATMSLIYVVGLLVTPFAGPETKGKPLPT